MAFAHELRILPHFDVRRDAVPFDFPRSVQSADADVRRFDATAVLERRRSADADEATPRPHADERPELLLTEIPRQRVAARPGELVDQHHLRAVDRERRIEKRFAVARLYDRERLTLEIVDDVVGDLAAVIETLVEDDALLSDLREEIAIEVREPAVARIRKIHVRELSAAELVDFAPVALDPVVVAEIGLARDRHDGHVARALARRRRTDADDDLFAGRLLESGVHVVVRRQVAALHGEQILAGADARAGLRERRLQRRVPIFAVEDLREAVAAVLDLVIRAEETRRHPLLRRLRAAAHEHVPDREIAQHLAEEKREVVARRDVREIRLETFLRGRDVEAVMVRIVEEVAFHAPRLAIHLLPLGERVEVHFEVRRGEFARARVGRFFRAGQKPLVVLLVERFRAVRGDGEVRHVGDVRRRLARRDVVLHDGHLRRLLVVLHERHRRDVQFARFSGRETRNVGLRDRQRDDALQHTLEVDLDVGDFPVRLHGGLRLRFGGGVFHGRLRSRGRSRRRGGRGFVLRRAFVVALRLDGRRLVVREHGDVNVAADRMLIARHVEALRRETGIGACREVQQFAARVELRILRVAEAVRDLVDATFGERIHEDGVQIIRQDIGVTEPAAIGRPRDVELVRAETAVGRRHDVHDRAARDVDVA